MSGWRHPNQRRAEDLPVELRRTPLTGPVREWIRVVTGSLVLSARRLPGASSAAVHAVALSDGRTLVLRRYVWEEFSATEPEVPGRELEALEFAAAAGLPVPAVVAADLAGEAVGDGIPILLMTRIRGRAAASPDVARLAQLLLQIHRVSPAGFGHQYFPWCRDQSTRPPQACRNPGLWQQALEVWRSAEPAYRPCFVHRDFHPGNVLWWRGAVSGVVDWGNACSGPPGIDVATCRANLLNWADAESAAAFVSAYEGLTSQRYDRYWDLASILEEDWDRIDAPERVWAAEARLAATLPDVVAKR